MFKSLRERERKKPESGEHFQDKEGGQRLKHRGWSLGTNGCAGGSPCTSEVALGCDEENGQVWEVPLS